MAHAGLLIFAVACGIFSCGIPTLTGSMPDLVPQPGIATGPPALGTQSLSHCTLREVPYQSVLYLGGWVFLLLFV